MRPGPDEGQDSNILVWKSQSKAKYTAASTQAITTK